MTVPIPDGDTLTWDAVECELRDWSAVDALRHTLDHGGPEGWAVVGDWTRELLTRFPRLRADEAFSVAVTYYFG